MIRCDRCVAYQSSSSACHPTGHALAVCLFNASIECYERPGICHPLIVLASAFSASFLPSGTLPEANDLSSKDSPEICCRWLLLSQWKQPCLQRRHSAGQPAAAQPERQRAITNFLTKMPAGRSGCCLSLACLACWIVLCDTGHNNVLSGGSPSLGPQAVIPKLSRFRAFFSWTLTQAG